MAPKCWWYLWSKRPWLFLSPLQKSCWAANAPGNSGCRWSFAETPDLSGWSRSAFCQGGRKASGENTIFWQKAIILRSKMSHFGSLKNCAVTCVRGMSKVKSSCQTDINFEIKLYILNCACNIFQHWTPPAFSCHSPLLDSLSFCHKASVRVLQSLQALLVPLTCNKHVADCMAYDVAFIPLQALGPRKASPLCREFSQEKEKQWAQLGV